MINDVSKKLSAKESNELNRILKVKESLKLKIGKVEAIWNDEYRVKFKNRDKLYDFMTYIKEKATELNFGYDWGQTMAYAVIENDQCKIHFHSPKASNGDNNYFQYGENFGFYINFYIELKSKKIERDIVIADILN